MHGTHSNAATSRQADDLFGDVVGTRLRAPPTPAPRRGLAAAPTACLAFAECARLGYGPRLVPIIPPDAPISERSSLFKRVGTKQDGRGKTPGVRGRDGKWSGFDWLPYEATADDLVRWEAMGAGVGIKTGDGLVLIDADTLNEAHAAIIAEAVEKHFGQLPMRIGRAPKVGYVLRTTEPVRYQRIEFGSADEKGRLPDRVEILSDGRQFVAQGVHPKTSQPYFWPRPLPSFEKLPRASAAQVTAFLEDLRGLLSAAKPIVTEGSTTAINQEALKGRVDVVRKAVAAIPNTSASFPTRESYRDFGYAIKAALPDAEATAFELFSDWCARWEDGENDPEIVAADWRRMKPPFRRGAGWLYELAEQHAPAQFSRAEQWFESPSENDNLFPDGKASANSRTLDIITLQDAAGGALDHQNRPLVKGLLDQGTLSVLYGDSNTGKTFVATDMAHAIASGRPWGGLKTSKCAVLYVAAEGGNGVRKRSLALTSRYPTESAVARFYLRLSNINLLRADQDLEPLIRTVRQLGEPVGLIVIDTLSRAMAGGDENASTDMGVIVKNFDRIREATGAHVMVVHHTGKDKAKGARGHSILRAALDTEIEVADGKITVTKQRDIDKAFGVAFTLRPVVVGVDQEGDTVTSCTIDLADMSTAVSVNPDQRDEALRLISENDWLADVRARDSWAGVPIAQAYGLDLEDAADKAEAMRIQKQLLRDGFIRYEIKNNERRKPKRFVRVVRAPVAHMASKNMSGVFA